MNWEEKVRTFGEQLFCAEPVQRRVFGTMMEDLCGRRIHKGELCWRHYKEAMSQK